MDLGEFLTSHTWTNKTFPKKMFWIYLAQLVDIQHCDVVCPECWPWIFRVRAVTVCSLNIMFAVCRLMVLQQLSNRDAKSLRSFWLVVVWLCGAWELIFQCFVLFSGLIELFLLKTNSSFFRIISWLSIIIIIKQCQRHVHSSASAFFLISSRTINQFFATDFNKSHMYIIW